MEAVSLLDDGGFEDGDGAKLLDQFQNVSVESPFRRGGVTGVVGAAVDATAEMFQEGAEEPGIHLAR